MWKFFFFGATILGTANGFVSLRCGYLGFFGDGNACALSCLPLGYTSGYCEYDQCHCGQKTEPLNRDLITDFGGNGNRGQDSHGFDLVYNDQLDPEPRNPPESRPLDDWHVNDGYESDTEYDSGEADESNGRGSRYGHGGKRRQLTKFLKRKRN
eukprot:maker-scaffold481_size160081-snap-gene-0.14 protein:Tk12151 transcript:maker-scaffold481_size160081-snap-gene-0.14-mRNA-1 annotation:"hypothetical protein Moror_14386"